MEEEVSAGVRCYPKDFLKRFGSSGEEAATEAKTGELCELELSLGLSLGRCSEPDKERCFVRSPSTDSLFSMFPLGNDAFPAAGTSLARACSLPKEAPEEQKKRKELQSLKRLETKRKRSEKRRPKPGAEEDRNDEVWNEELDDGQRLAAAAGPVNGVVPLLPPAPVRLAGFSVDASKYFTPETRALTGSQGSGLSGISDFDCNLKKGFNLSGQKDRSEIKSFSTTTFSHKRSNPTRAVDGKHAPCGTEEDDESWKASGRVINGVKKELERDMMQEMPCVSTRGDGPNGRRIEGFLYKYRKGEEVRIVCECHGRFFTPAEFVKHAGGGDVAHPLRHIVVNPPPVALL